MAVKENRKMEVEGTLENTKGCSSQQSVTVTKYRRQSTGRRERLVWLTVGSVMVPEVPLGGSTWRKPPCHGAGEQREVRRRWFSHLPSEINSFS